MKPSWKHWKYKNTTWLVVSVSFFLYFSGSDTVQNFIDAIGNLGYVGSFLTGILFVSTFTFIPATSILFNLAQSLDSTLVVVTAGSGAVLGDYLLFRYLKDRVFEELKPLFVPRGRSFLSAFFSSPFFHWLIPIFGAFVIVSPLPNEVGISLMGLSRINRVQFLLITFALNFLGIFLIVSFAQAV